MTRSLWKGPFLNVQLPASFQQIIRTQSRSTTIIPAFVGRKFEVHNGRRYIPLMITEQMVGHKLGEFARTRKPFHFKKTDKKR